MWMTLLTSVHKGQNPKKETLKWHKKARRNYWSVNHWKLSHLKAQGIQRNRAIRKSKGRATSEELPLRRRWQMGGKKPRTGDSEQSRGRLYTLQRRQQYFWKSRKACFEAIVFYSLELVLWQSKESSGNSVQALLTSPARHSCPSGNSFSPVLEIVEWTFVEFIVIFTIALLSSL